jgi:hypothetical protein
MLCRDCLLADRAYRFDRAALAVWFDPISAQLRVADGEAEHLPNVYVLEIVRR